MSAEVKHNLSVEQLGRGVSVKTGFRHTFHITSDSLTVFLGGAGMDGPYIDDQVAALREAGIQNVRRGSFTAGTSDDVSGVFQHYDRTKNIIGFDSGGPFIREADWSLGAMGVSSDPPSSGQFNLIGYSWGATVAAQAALYYADKGHHVNHVVLIAAPISMALYRGLQEHSSIGHVVNVDLEANGDPIHPGLNLLELSTGFVRVCLDFVHRESGEGHFYYAPDNALGRSRRRDLAKWLFGRGLR